MLQCNENITHDKKYSAITYYLFDILLGGDGSGTATTETPTETTISSGSNNNFI